MLLTIISTILGILTSAIPNLIRIWEKRIDAKYEIELTKIRIEAIQAGLKVSKEIEDIREIVREGESTREHDTFLVGSPFIENLRASVRPVITYTLFFLFVFVKLTAFAVLMNQGVTVQNIEIVMKVLFDDATVAIFSTVLGFWFGARALEKFNEMQDSKRVVYINKEDGTVTPSKRRK